MKVKELIEYLQEHCYEEDQIAVGVLELNKGVVSGRHLTEDSIIRDKKGTVFFTY